MNDVSFSLLPLSPLNRALTVHLPTCFWLNIIIFFSLFLCILSFISPSVSLSLFIAHFSLFQPLFFAVCIYHRDFAFLFVKCVIFVTSFLKLNSSDRTLWTCLLHRLFFSLFMDKCKDKRYVLSYFRFGSVEYWCYWLDREIRS